MQEFKEKKMLLICRKQENREEKAEKEGIDQQNVRMPASLRK